MPQCPVCKKENIWKYGKRNTRKGLKRRFLCKDCGHLWEVLEEEKKQDDADFFSKTRIPVELRDYFVEMMGQIVDDVQNGVELEKAGWISFNKEIEKQLIKTGLSESSKAGIRLVISSKSIPRELAWTEEGDIVLDFQKAAVLGELLSEIAKDQTKRIGAEYSGLVRMFQTSEFPILASLPFKEGLNAEAWFIKAPMSAKALALDLVEKTWGNESSDKGITSLKSFGLPIPKTEMQEEEDSDKIKKILRWEVVIKIIEPEIIEALGFLWYVDYLMGSRGIKYLESIRIVQKITWDILEIITGRTIQEIEEDLMEATRVMETMTTDSRGEGESKETNQITDWYELVRLPW